MLDNYEVLLGVWNEALSLQLDFEMRARITGVNTRMHTFGFLFDVSLRNHLLCHTNNLSKTLQHKSLSPAESQTVAKMTLDVFSGFSVGLCINEEEGYLLPTIARKITC